MINMLKYRSHQATAFTDITTLIRLMVVTTSASKVILHHHTPLTKIIILKYSELKSLHKHNT